MAVLQVPVVPGGRKKQPVFYRGPWARTSPRAPTPSLDLHIQDGAGSGSQGEHLAEGHREKAASLRTTPRLLPKPCCPGRCVLPSAWTHRPAVRLQNRVCPGKLSPDSPEVPPEGTALGGLPCLQAPPLEQGSCPNLGLRH